MKLNTSLFLILLLLLSITTIVSASSLTAQQSTSDAGLSHEVLSQLAYMNTNPTHYGDVFNHNSPLYDQKYDNGEGSSHNPYNPDL
jgi:hypothetical protein